MEDTSTLNKKGVTIGLPREEKIVYAPGPGEYDEDSSKMLRANQGSVRIGTEVRKDIWEEQVKNG